MVLWLNEGVTDWRCCRAWFKMIRITRYVAFDIMIPVDADTVVVNEVAYEPQAVAIWALRLGPVHGQTSADEGTPIGVSTLPFRLEKSLTQQKVR